MDVADLQLPSPATPFRAQTSCKQVSNLVSLARIRLSLPAGPIERGFKTGEVEQAHCAGELVLEDQQTTGVRVNRTISRQWPQRLQETTPSTKCLSRLLRRSSLASLQQDSTPIRCSSAAKYMLMQQAL